MPHKSFRRRVELPVSAAEGFQWHERPGALQRLIPPWESVRVLRNDGGVKDGARVELENRLGPLRFRWIAEHHDYEAGRKFCDTQLSGPFARWEHTHSFESAQDGSGFLEDNIEYKVPGGLLGRWIAGRFIYRKIDRMFEYRHDTTVDDLAAHARYEKTMHVAVSGSNGLVGSALVPMLTTGGHQVTRLVRGTPREDEVAWDPQASSFDASPLDGVDAVVHLAGKSIASSRWSAKVKQEIRDSRVQGTRLLCEGLARMASPPEVLVSASAIGYYGDRGDEKLDETSSAGEGFLAEVAKEWEAATKPASDAGIRVVHLRFGVIFSPKDGALAKMLLPFRLGGGGRVGSGRQWWSWISVDDAVGAIHHALMTDSLRGPINAVAPNPVTFSEFAKTLGRVLRRPTILPMPAFAARLALGEMANELILASTRVEPKELTESGYEFRQPTLEKALRHLLGK